ncbi:MAG TPA: proton-conducting transporter membrane subunit [Syntrophomonadaceae bacterium]|nr:proton-conducting transporter membrane subunit [Syntrophomonadaceae bacterium]
MNAIQTIWAAFAALSIGGLLTLLSNRHKTSGVIATLATGVAFVLCLLAAKMVWTGNSASEVVRLLDVTGFPARLSFNLDKIGALFAVLITGISTIAALFSTGYLSSLKGESPKRYYFLFLMFVMGMLGVVTVSDLFYFFMFWEFMTLASYFLVVYQRGNERNLKAGWTYFFMTHLTSIGIFINVIFIGGKAGSFDFSAMPGVLEGLAKTNPLMVHLIIGLFFLAFATKAGIYPLGFWLPEAYRSAPAPISAILSGVMSKLAVFGLLRFTWFMIHDLSILVPWGYVAVLLGTLSMIVGNLRALNENDAKRLVAQSSIGQMGYIWLGIGIGFVFAKLNPVISLIGFVGAIYHLLNHSCFKSLLFLNTGTVEFISGSKDLNKISGLIKIIPFSTGAALVGSLAISGVPPFNGFMSKWMIYQSAIFGAKFWPVLGLCGVAAIFISTVSLAAYMKFFGSAFLGPLSGDLTEKSANPVSMRAAESILSLLCLIGGVLPGLVVPLAIGTVVGTGPFGADFTSATFKITSLYGVIIHGAQGTIGQAVPTVVGICLIAAIFISAWIYRQGRSGAKIMRVWNCGEVVTAEETMYRARSFYEPFKEHFRSLYRVPKGIKLQLSPKLAKALDLDNFYLPLGRNFVTMAKKMSSAHNGKTQYYLLWQVVGLLVVVVLMFYILGG